MNAADTGFMLIASAMVMLMTPGLAVFYGGLVRAKNILSVIMHSFACMGIVSVIWVLYGYSLAFGPDMGGVLGNFDLVMLKGVGLEAGPFAPGIPHVLFCAFQLMFAIITPALITGAFAERMRFWPFFGSWSSGRRSYTCPYATGSGGADGFRSWERSILRAERLFMSTRARRPS